MDNDFLKNQLDLERQSTWLDSMELNLAFIRSSDFDPLKLDLKSFSPMTTPQEVDARHELERETDEEFQLAIVTNCIERLQTTLLLIEAQKSLNLQIDEAMEPRLAMCIAADQEQATDIVGQTTSSLKVVGKMGLSGFQEIVLIRAPFNAASEQLVDLMQDRISPRILDMGEEQLVQKIGQVRMDFSTLEVSRNFYEITRAGKQLDHAIYLLKARDEGIAPKTDFIQEQIETRLQFAEKAVGETRPRIEQLNYFINEVQYMEEYPVSASEFNPTRYLPMSIRVVPQFTP